MLRRMHSDSGFSMSEIVVTVMIMLILGMIIQANFFGARNAAHIDNIASKLDVQAAQIMTWASGQEDFDEQGKRASVLGGSSALTLVAQTTRTPLTEWVVASASGSGSVDAYAPADKLTSLVYNVEGDGEHIRLSHCRDNDPSTHRICLRVDMYPWGNQTSGDQPVIYRSIECVGATCGGTKLWTTLSCRAWVKGEEVMKRSTGEGDPCPVDSSADSSPTLEDGLSPYVPSVPLTGGPWPLKVDTTEGGTVQSGTYNLGTGGFSGDGIIDCPTQATKCNASYTNNAQIALKAIPANGYSFVGWSGAACASDQVCTVTMSQAWDVSARFALTSSLSGTYQQITVSAGSYHTCATDTVGALYCWGRNNYGQLGDGTTTDRSTPTAVKSSASGAALTGVKEAVVGSYSSCAIMADNTVKCWGSNQYGQLGNGTTTDSYYPAQVKDSIGTGVLSGVTDLALGNGHACARVSVVSGVSIQCWGLNGNGQLGNGSTTNRSLPTAVTALSGSALVWVGENYSCAKLSSAFNCWGLNNYGQLGIGNAVTPQKTPQSISSILAGSGVVGRFGSHSCATDSTGGAYCWGLNGKGQLGNSSTTNSNVPVSPTGLTSGIASITGGYEFSCSLSTSKSVKCWGDNAFKQLGSSATGTTSTTPVLVSGLTSGVLGVSSGSYHSCAVLSGDILRCWGRNDYNQLGDGSTINQSSPVIVNLP